MRNRLVLASIALLLFGSGAGAENVVGQTCLPGVSDGEALIQVAQADGDSGIVSRTATSIRFKSGYGLRIAKRGGRTLVLVSTPGVSKSTGTVTCGCSGSGACFPTIGSGPAVICTSGDCSSCEIKLTHTPPPAPNP